MFDRIPHIYYYVPPCPACGSRKTGRYVRQPLTAGDMRFVEVESLRSGELIRFAPRIPEKNVYCEDCGHEWACSIRASLMPRERIGRKVGRLYGTQPREKEVGFREDIRVPAMRKEETECCI